MKKTMLTMVLLMITVMLSAGNKNDTTVVFTTLPQMHCEQCELKIKNNLRFEKGVKDIQTNVGAQTVMVKFSKKKTNASTILKGFQKFGYEARVLNDGEKVSTLPDENGCENM